MQQSRLSYALLGMLMREELTGYDMAKRCETDLSWFWYGSFGQIYPLLNRMLKDGWVSVREEPGQKGRPRRKVYAITVEGRKVFHRWMKEPPVEDLFRSELLIKLHFGELGDPQVISDWIEGLRQHSLQVVSIISGIMEQAGQQTSQGVVPPFQKILADRGLTINRGFVEWCERTLDVLQELQPGSREEQSGESK